VSLDGVAFLDHTADVGIAVEADSFRQLLHRAAMGMLALLRGEEEDTEDPGNGGAGEEGAPTPPVAISLRADDTAGLVAAWLREILFLHEVRGTDYVAAELGRVEPTAIEGWIRVVEGGRAAREIKGVTYHELEVEETVDGRWRGRVIFDV
jgi:SHS2 domain-containing protein